MYTLFEYKTKYQEEEVAKIKSMLFQAIAGNTVRKSEKTYRIILSGIRLNQRNHFAEGQASLRVAWHVKNNFSVKKKCVQEYFQNMVLA